jgi:hypothetical protein
MKSPQLLILMSLGPNVVVNGDFSDGATGWTDRKTGAGSTLSFAGGVATITGTDGSNRGWFTQSLTLLPLRWYRVTLTVAVTSGNVNLIFGSTTGSGAATISTSGDYSYRLQATAATMQLGAQTGAGGGNVTIDNMTVRRC